MLTLKAAIAGGAMSKTAPAVHACIQQDFHLRKMLPSIIANALLAMRMI